MRILMHFAVVRTAAFAFLFAAFVSLAAAAPVTTVTLIFSTPPSGQGNNFTVECDVTDSIPSLKTYNFDIFYDNSTTSNVLSSGQDLSGIGQCWVVGPTLGGGGFPGCDTHLRVWANGSAVSNVTSLFRVSFTQLLASPSGIYMYMQDDPDFYPAGLYDGSSTAIEHAFSADSKYLPVTASRFSVE